MTIAHTELCMCSLTPYNPVCLCVCVCHVPLIVTIGLLRETLNRRKWPGKGFSVNTRLLDTMCANTRTHSHAHTQEHQTRCQQESKREGGREGGRECRWGKRESRDESVTEILEGAHIIHAISISHCKHGVSILPN
jgi:hypothetical protein